MRLVIFLLVLGVGIVFFVQNQQPVTLVFLGNLASARLSIALWVLLFIAAGAITSIFWQILSSFQKPSVSQNFQAERSRPYSPPPPPRTPQISSDYRPPQDISRSPQQTPVSSAKSDWEARNSKEEWDDWEVEKPAPEPIRESVREPVRESIRDSVREFATREPSPVSENRTDNVENKLEEDKSTVFEVEQKPKTSTRTGSVYSYVYREPRERPEKEKDTDKPKQENKSDRVYDADYRVIRPPYRETLDQQTRQDEEEEDWI
jgi:hypothetical protein